MNSVINHNLVLILDEVQTAMGRLGPLFGYQSHGIIPDIITMAKSLGGGAPIGAMLAKGHVAASFVPGTHAATFGGNPLVTAAACATVKTILDENLGENAVKMGDYLESKLMALKDQYPIKEVRGKGLLRGLVAVCRCQRTRRQVYRKWLNHDLYKRLYPSLFATAQYHHRTH